ncbi:hypothetical protein A3B21_01480 [Candidatus Uhrbacteria bacterium RIFCSPLOWO2_01_FULL_47_24]|uniref:Uncharacterized protein n=1 Tax=Candidatus Uhrbacteria bacterium RIFCSPLOWO2_01_FULL_47_24 TaxID=1802401 RepID=A0A1F7UNU2_9BACT|nr:MAG: hypothetical protein A3D58_02855 [Candidatus Uhrbacteria bacterium RIFCSPHIGHO2_02_FULL_46_47]OGL76719.1 MAG: hypothetical protein A3F52_00480 [Candidatus Uhrbacteria bacterium RIFCSPHIGHO2_12_FULL_47_11]OGL79946.1 MAG: hypothetical protein A3B21_01480 [Candidatus Uhrbacteria bacterium RIFCSPLOWO2_01_FULL_47_24]OGL84202.1 MAG: hypothetical protein A3J03_02075 [Candidatus Uhrbacteria bacterium RIFCSPLOWO2_02_FULL_46_25]OGL93352.1 MAG: hypothetical protein A3H11_02540 [Candidatus Uhrbacte
MHDDKWKDTVAMIKSKFNVLDERREEILDIPNAFVEIIEFSAKGGSASGGESPQGKMKLERVTRPVVLDKKTIYSKTGGRASKIEYQYSTDELTHRLQAYRWNEAAGQWEEVRTPMA